MIKAFSILTMAAAFALSGCIIIVDEDGDDDHDYELASALAATDQDAARE